MRVAIAGAGKVGRAIARELVVNGHQVLLIDKDAALARPGAVEGADTLLAELREYDKGPDAYLNRRLVRLLDSK